MSSEAKYSVTVKTPKGNLVSVRGDTSEEWVANLTGAAEALALIGQIENSLAGQPGRAPGIDFSKLDKATEARKAAEAQPAQDLPAGYGVRCDTCQAPAQLQQEGISSKSGKPYKRYSCTANQLHKATFTS